MLFKGLAEYLDGIYQEQKKEKAFKCKFASNGVLFDIIPNI